MVDELPMVRARVLAELISIACKLSAPDNVFMLIPAVVAVPVLAKMATSSVAGEIPPVQFAPVSQAVAAVVSPQVMSAAWEHGEVSGAAMATKNGRDKPEREKRRFFMVVGVLCWMGELAGVIEN